MTAAGPQTAPLTTRSTVLLTASDTLCLTSAAVPGLLNLFVNFRTSDIVLLWLKSTSYVPVWIWTCRGTGCGGGTVGWQPDVGYVEGETASGSSREAGLVLLMRGQQRGRNSARCFTRSYFRFSSVGRTPQRSSMKTFSPDRVNHVFLFFHKNKIYNLCQISCMLFH